MKTLCYFVIFCLIVSFASESYAETWSIEDITAASYYYVWEMDGAVDSDGDMHIAINRQDWLRYATNASGSWTVTSNLTEINGDVSIVLDSAGKAHIAGYRFISLNDQAIVYATNSSGSWAYTEIPTAGYLYQCVSIALDSAENVYIAYCEVDEIGASGDERLYYITNATDSWVSHLIDGGYDTGRFCSLAIDSVDALHVSYCESDESTVRYATNASGSWVISTVNGSPVDYAKDTDIAIDQYDKPHISYFEYEDNYNGQLRYAEKPLSTWNNYVVDASGNAGARSSIAVTQDGKPRIAYFDIANDKVKYARNSTGSWYTQQVADSEGPCAVAMDSSYAVHIGFDAQQLRHAYTTPVTPLPPENLEAFLLPGQIHVTWEDHSSNENGFLLQYRWSPTITPGWQTLAVLNPNVTSYQMNGPGTGTTYRFRVCAFNANGDSSWSNEDSIYAGLILSYINIQSPNGGEDWPAGSSHTITWTNGYSPPSQVNLYYSLNGGSSWTTIVTNVFNTGSYAWTVPNVSSTNCLVKVKSASGSMYDLSNAPFTISYRPDLIVESIQTVPERPLIGQSFQLKVTVKNQGTVAAGSFWLSWYKSQSTPPELHVVGDQYEQVSSLAAGASYTMTKTVTSWQYGTFSMWAQADSEGQVIETNESNNILGPQDLDVLLFEVLFESGTNNAWFGGDDRDAFKPRNIAYGQSVTLNWPAQVQSVGFEFSGPFDYYDNPERVGHEVTLVVNCRASNGAILSSVQEVVPATFAGGWIYFDIDQRLCAGQEFIFTCYLLNGETTELTNFIKGDSTASFTEGRGYYGSTHVYGGDMENWAIWQLGTWDYHFRTGGFYFSLVADITGDGDVDIDDLASLAQWWLETYCYDSQWCDCADINCSGSVNLADLAELSKAWGL